MENETTETAPGWWKGADGKLYPPISTEATAAYQSPKKKLVRRFYDWSRQSWKRKILVGFAALIALSGIAHAAGLGKHTPAPTTSYTPSYNYSPSYGYSSYSSWSSTTQTPSYSSSTQPYGVDPSGGSGQTGSAAWDPTDNG